MTDGTATIPDEIVRLGDRYRSAVEAATRRVVAGGCSRGAVEELAEVVADHANDELAAWRGRPEAPTGIACRPGCSYCCHVEVATTIPEVARIASTLASERTPAELAVVRDRIERHYQLGLGPDGQRRPTIGRTCPLLEAGSCSIHEYRPLICRGWNSLDVIACISFYQQPTQTGRIPIDPIQKTITEGIANGIQAGLESEGLDSQTVELIAALRIALDDPTAVDRWLDGEPAFRDAAMSG